MGIKKESATGMNPELQQWVSSVQFAVPLSLGQCFFVCFTNPLDNPPWESCFCSPAPTNCSNSDCGVCLVKYSWKLSDGDLEVMWPWCSLFFG